MISCKEYVEIRKKKIREQISILSKNNRVPHLGVIQIGSNDASERYIKGKKKDCEGRDSQLLILFLKIIALMILMI